jgi:hypothetical protein
VVFAAPKKGFTEIRFFQAGLPAHSEGERRRLCQRLLEDGF